MKKNKVPIFTCSVVAIILGITLFKQFDFENLKFEKTELAIVYTIGFIISIYLLIKSSKNKQQ